MRINAVTRAFGAGFKGRKNQAENPYFKGKTHTILVNVKTEAEKRKHLTEDDKVSLLQRQSLAKGSKHLEPVKGACEPDYMLIGKIYYADWNEWPNDRVYEEHTAVVADSDKLEITKERVQPPTEDNPDVLYAQIVSLRESIRFQEGKKRGALKQVDKIDEETDGVFKDPSYNPRTEAMMKKHYQRCRFLQISEYRGKRASDLREMKSTVSKNLVDLFRYMQARDYDYFKDNKAFLTDPDPYYLKLREQLFEEKRQAEEKGTAGETGYDFLLLED